MFNKKRKDLPPLPDMGELPPLPEEDFNAYPMRPRLARGNEEFPPMPEESGLPPIDELPPLPRRPTMEPIGREPEPMPEIAERATVFIKIDKYKEIVQNLERMQQKIEELHASLDKISSIKNKEAEIIDGWYALLQNAKAKVDEVNIKLSKPEEV